MNVKYTRGVRLGRPAFHARSESTRGAAIICLMAAAVVVIMWVVL